MLDPSEKSVFQVSETQQMSDKNSLPFRGTRKSYATMLEKKFKLLYLEHFKKF